MTTQNPPVDRQKALRLRERVKAKKPKFLRPESWRYVRLKENWRKPKGLDNKVRKSIKGWPPGASAGYGGPRLARGLHPSGYEEVMVHRVEDLEGLDPKLQAIRIGHRVGRRKKVGILTEARRTGLVVLNIREIKVPVTEKEETTEEIAEETSPSVEKEEAESKEDAIKAELAAESNPDQPKKPRVKRRASKR